MMMDLAGVSRVALRELEYGSLFVPVVEHGNHFVAGRINAFELLVALDGEKPFLASERREWSRAPGLQIAEVRFEVEIGEAVRVDGSMDLRKGMLLMSGAQIGIGAFERHETFPVWVLGDGQLGGEGAIGFSKWQIVRGTGQAKQVLFTAPAVVEA